MTRCPAVGDRVSYPGGLAVGPCVGTVTRVYPAYRWDEDLDRETWDLLPESKWSVEMKVDEIPSRWAYDERGLFAPEVKMLKRLR